MGAVKAKQLDFIKRIKRKERRKRLGKRLVDLRKRSRTYRADKTTKRISIYGVGTPQDYHGIRAQREIVIRNQDLILARKERLRGLRSRPLNFRQLQARIKYALELVETGKVDLKFLREKYNPFIELELLRNTINAEEADALRKILL